MKLFVEQGWVISSIRFDVWHNRNNKRIRLDVNFAEIEFNDHEEYLRMREYYRKTAEVPMLEHPYVNPFNDAKNRIRLVPVGVERKPNSLDELEKAIKQICTCLLSLHELGYFHCDVRWNNIIEYFGDWYLIDSEYACHKNEHKLLAERSAHTIKKRFVMDSSKPWNHLFDLYQVGRLLEDSTFTASSPGLSSLRDDLLSKQFTIVTVKRAIASL